MLLSTPPTALYWRRSFPGDAEQARAARRFTSCLLAGFPALDEVLLTVDELVVNALRLLAHSGRAVAPVGQGPQRRTPAQLLAAEPAGAASWHCIDPRGIETTGDLGSNTPARN